MNTQESFGARIARLRRRSKLSQKALGDRIGSSQATISRVERSDKPLDDIRQMSELARALGVRLTDLLDGLPTPIALLPQDAENFYAFCPNPFCVKNGVGLKADGSPYVTWSSGQFIAMEEFNETNYCERCGESLVKSCPSCGKHLTKSATRYCVTCGASVSKRPTEEEWTQIGEMELEEPPF